MLDSLARACHMIDLDQIVKKIRHIPPLPDVVLKVLEISGDPDCSAADLVNVIKLDQGITLRVLRLCNAAYYGLPRRVSSLHEALVFLGNTTLVNFILTSYASDFFQTQTPGYGLESGELWRHAVAAALASELIAEDRGIQEKGLLFTAALLHDVGKIVLHEHVVADIERIRDMVETESASLIEAEKEVLGCTHAEVGGHIASHWNLPPVLVNSIRYHHDPQLAPDNQDEAALVHLANTMCLMAGFGIGNGGQRHRIEITALARFELTIASLMQLSAKLHEQFAKAAELIRLSAAA